MAYIINVGHFMIKKLTLCIVHDHPRVLLGLKKRGFGVGRWNGFGGKVEPGETVENAAKREIFEEAGIRVGNLEKVGKIDFEFLGDPEILEVHVFKAENFHGELAESEEMKPQWFHIDEIPFSEMWPDDKYWMSLFLKNKKFRGRFLFEGQNEIISHSLWPANSI